MTARTHLAAAALVCLASGAAAGDGSRPQSGELTLPDAVLLEVADLWEHGDRFEPVIRAVIAEHAKPHWACAEACGEPLIMVPEQPSS